MSASQAQPRALYVLTMTGFWERLGAAFLSSVLALYLIDELGVAEEQAFLVFGAFVSLLYLTAIVGGVAADRVFGYGRAILFGALLMTVGYIMLASGDVNLTYAGLGLAVAGTGFFKPNTTALLGEFYRDDDPRRISGFTLFYSGSNVGALFGIVSAGFVAQQFGYPVGFALAAAAKLVSLLVYAFGRRWLEARDRPTPQARDTPIGNGCAILSAILVATGCALCLMFPERAGVAIGATVVAVLLFYLYRVSQQEREVRNRLLAHLAVLIAAVVFGALYVQYATSIALYTQEDVRRNIFGWHLPASVFRALNPAFMLALSPLLIWLWPWLTRRHIRIDDFLKLVLGLLLIGGAYWVVYAGIRETPDGAKAALSWVVLYYGVYTLAELCLVPVGMALTTRLAPRHMSGLVMGVWFVSVAAASYVGGWLATIVDVPKGAAPAQEVAIYAEGFLIYGAIGVVAGIVMLAAIRWLRRLMGAPPPQE